MSVDALVNELLALNTLDESTIADLKAAQQAAADGTLDADDEAYIRALHARLTGQPVAAAEEPAAPIDPETLDGLTIAQWRDRALAAEAEAAALRDRQAPADQA